MALGKFHVTVDPDFQERVDGFLVTIDNVVSVAREFLAFGRECLAEYRTKIEADDLLVEDLRAEQRRSEATLENTKHSGLSDSAIPAAVDEGPLPGLRKGPQP